jgi:hypothetical protein
MNAAVVNDAYNMLKTPNTRVKYLVRIAARRGGHLQPLTVCICWELSIAGIAWH